MSFMRDNYEKFILDINETWHLLQLDNRSVYLSSSFMLKIIGILLLPIVILIDADPCL